MTPLLLGLVIAAQNPANQGPYWTWATSSIIKGAGEERNLATRLEMILLAVYRAGLEHDVESHALALSVAGSTYSRLGDQKRAFSCYETALALRPSPERQASLRNNLAIACNETSRYKEAERYAKESLSFWASKKPATSASTRGSDRALNQLGNAQQYQGHFEAALTTFKQCLVLRYQADGPGQQAGTQANIGSVLLRLGRNAEAFEYLSAALVAQRSDPALIRDQADTLSLMAESIQQNSPELAVTLLKESVSLIQSERRTLKGAKQDLQSAFVETNSEPYRQLASLLLKLGRVGEAVRVLDLLKVQEANDYFRGDSDNLIELSKGPREKEIEELWKRIPEEAGLLFLEFDRLRAIPDKTPEQRRRSQELADRLSRVHEAVFEIYKTIEGRSRDIQGDSFRALPIKDLQTTISRINRDTGISTAALRVFATNEEVITVVVTADAPQIFRTQMKGAEWNELVGNLGLALRYPSLDPRELSKKVFDVIFRRAERELNNRKVGQLICSLDGPLRYVPLGALWDGKDYLLNRYCISYFTPNTRLETDHDKTWQVAGFAGGGSKKYGLSDLPGAKAEVESIVEATTGDGGTFPGLQLIGSTFTADALFNLLDLRKQRVFHLATHFVLKADLDDSFLMSGDDQPISLSDLRKRYFGGSLFQEIDLLYLSACSTAEITPGGLKGDGREFDSFAFYALEEQALTVIATLWSLNDSSGSLLAESFYRIRKANPSLSLSEVAKRAQLATMNVTGRTGGNVRSEPTAPPPNLPNCPLFIPDPKRPFAHPYYWAPLVLYGSFR